MKGAICLQPFQSHPDEIEGESASLLRCFLRPVYFLLISKINPSADRPSQLTTNKEACGNASSSECFKEGNGEAQLLSNYIESWGLSKTLCLHLQPQSLFLPTSFSTCTTKIGLKISPTHKTLQPVQQKLYVSKNCDVSIVIFQ